MSILKSIASQFDPEVLNRGDRYFNSNFVKSVSIIRGQEAVFRVEGTKTYNVRLRYDHNKLLTTCTCPDFGRGNHCKHAWASILKADSQNFFDGKTPIRDVGPMSENVPSNQLTLSTILKGPGKEKKDVQSLKQLPLWKKKLEVLNKLASGELKKQKQILSPNVMSTPHSRFGFFAIDSDFSSSVRKWTLKFYNRERKKNGELGILKPCSLNHELISLYNDELDQRALWSFLGMPAQANSYYYYEQKKDYVFLQPNMMDSILQELSDAKKLLIITQKAEVLPLKFDKALYRVKLILSEEKSVFILKAHLASEENRDKIYPIEPSSFYMMPYLLFGSEMIRTDFENQVEWFRLFKKDPQLLIPQEDVDGFLDYYFKSPLAPEISYPESLKIKTENNFSKMRLALDSDPDSGGIFGQIQFRYGEEFVNHSDSRNILFSSSVRTIYKRNLENEKNETSKLHDIPENLENSENFANKLSDKIEISQSKLSEIVDKAFQLGWEVIAFKKQVTKSKDFKAIMTSGVDWFDLSINFEFSNGLMLGLPQLLKNIKSGQRFISLADGTTGLIREEWIKKFSSMAQAGRVEGDSIRLTKIQALFYGAELCVDKNFKSDRKFKTFQKIIEDINNITEAKLDPRFKGKLREYQKRGFSWLSLMTKHEIGTVLADDMGLGKTVQILATLSKDRKSKTLILAPKSLVFNWVAEAKKFTPHLKFHDHTGSDRMNHLAELESANVIVTTYQTFRIDVDFFKQKEFDYFILDEAHFIKNSESQAYMASKLIKAKKKIALSGTPVENSLKDLFSILSVVTPGLISDALAEKYSNEMDPEAIGSLSKSLRPFILRRTKDEVLKDLPQKSQQVLYCELSASERRKYNELKNYYWNNLSGKIQKKGFQKSKIEILEALLRLRQASCHPGLLNANLGLDSSAKFDLLFEQIENVIADGHKALIFSQFTSLLGLLGRALDQRKIVFEYLDGKTNNRSERVRNFQENDNIQLFLISLKAGGVGLNLTSADYVFILDPWWNPAAESQAIDRVHRIGQTKKVFAYKLIAKDTVEEKILVLQERKRALAKAVISSEKSLIKGLQMEDLRELFE